jgi:GNAT superfamily N-acetyltransferase
VTDPVVEVVDADRFGALLKAAAHVYGAAMERPPELVVQRREIMHSHLGRSGFAAVVALDESAGNDGLVGFGYGYCGQAGEWWHDVVAKAMTRSPLGRSGSRPWLKDAFELAELHVLPDWQGRGIGRQLLDRLLATATGDTVILSTHDRESRARALYRSAGFVDLLCDFVFPGSAEVYAVMGLDRRGDATVT